MLERHAGYKSIHAYDSVGKADHVFKIVLEIELLGGHFLVRQGPDQFTLATNKLKKMTVQKRLRRKEKGSKRSVFTPDMAFLSSLWGGAGREGCRQRRTGFVVIVGGTASREGYI